MFDCQSCWSVTQGARDTRHRPSRLPSVHATRDTQSFAFTFCLTATLLESYTGCTRHETYRGSRLPSVHATRDRQSFAFTLCSTATLLRVTQGARDTRHTELRVYLLLTRFCLTFPHFLASNECKFSSPKNLMSYCGWNTIGSCGLQQQAM
jgi:hypothetical protein